tara:strand:- start:893 stop:1180 length:288 start_codon:yes stop_codon:yes gene_type:complete
MLGANQIKRVREQCLKVNESYNAGPDVIDFQDNDYYINVGWLQALNLVLEKDTSPISTTPLKNYKKGYNILMQFWAYIPDNVKEDVHKELKELDL